MNKSESDKCQKVLRRKCYIQDPLRRNLILLSERQKTKATGISAIIDHMPARNLRKNYRALTGLFADAKKREAIPFESSLERDFIYLLAGSKEIDDYRWQPVEIEYYHEGKERTYFPDFAVAFKRFSIQGKDWLVEIKYRSELRKKWHELRPKYKAATKYAMDRGMVFKIMTEKEIRTPFLKNMRFLINFMTIKTEEPLWGELVDTLKELRESSPREILAVIGGSKRQQAHTIPHLWYLISHAVIEADLSLPLNMNTRIWLPEPGRLTPELCQRIYQYRRG